VTDKDSVEGVPIEELEIAHVSKSDLKKLLLDFRIQCGETARVHELVDKVTGYPFRPQLVQEALLRVLENQTLILTGLASLLQIQVNHKDAFNEG